MTILPRYEDAFTALTTAEIGCLTRALGLPPMRGDRPWTGDAILAHCRSQHISHADVIMSLAQDRSVPAVQAVERLIMRPIDRRTPYEVNISRLKQPPGSHRERAPRAERGERPGTIPTTSIIRVIATSNPKKPGSESYTRFGYYEDGMTVQAFLDKGGKVADIRWDVERGHIRIADEEPQA